MKISSVCRVELSKVIFKMSHTNRPKCVACDRTIRSTTIRCLFAILLRIFVSIEQLKRVTATDAICNSCRLKYIRWKKLTMGDFNELNTTDSDDSELDDEVSENVDIVMLTLFTYKT